MDYKSIHKLTRITNPLQRELFILHSSFLILILHSSLFPFIYPAGQQEIDGGLNPQPAPLAADVGERRAHALYAHVAVHAEGRREEPRHILPERRDGGAGPRDAREEQQRHGEEDEEHDAVLAPPDERREHHGEEDARQEERNEEGEEREVVAELRQAEHAGDEREHIHSHHHVEQQIDQRLAADDAHGRGVSLVHGEDAAAETLARVARRHSDAEQQRLLDDEHQHGRDEECRETALRVVERRLLIFYRHAADFLLARRRAADVALHLYVLVHFERHVGGREHQRLVVEHGAHVAVDADTGLLAQPQVAAERRGYADDAVDLLTLQQLLGLGHVGAAGAHANVGRGVDHARKAAAKRRVRLVDYGRGHLAHHLVRIDVRIQQRIGQRHEDDEDQYALVAHHGGQLVIPYPDYV